MCRKEVLKIWKKISGLVADEIASNSDFAKKLASVVGADARVSRPAGQPVGPPPAGRPAAAPRGRPAAGSGGGKKPPVDQPAAAPKGRPAAGGDGGKKPPRGPRPGKPLEPAKINPHELLERGEDVLRKALGALNLDELKSVVGQYGLDVANVLKGVRAKKKHVDQIVDETKKEKEKVFWNN